MNLSSPVRPVPRGARRVAAALAVAGFACACGTLEPTHPPDLFVGLRGVVVAAPDPQRAVAWYAQLLGLGAEQQSLGYAGIAIGDDELDFDPQAQAGVVAFWSVTSIDAAFGRALELGAQPVTGIQEVGDERVAIVRDPFGNVLGLVETSTAAP